MGSSQCQSPVWVQLTRVGPDQRHLGWCASGRVGHVCVFCQYQTPCSRKSITALRPATIAITSGNPAFACHVSRGVTIAVSLSSLSIYAGKQRRDGVYEVGDCWCDFAAGKQVLNQKQAADLAAEPLRPLFPPGSGQAEKPRSVADDWRYSDLLKNPEIQSCGR